MHWSFLGEKIPFFLLMMGIGLLLPGAVATYETETEINFHTGNYRTRRSIFHIVPLGETSGPCVWLRDCFPTEVRAQLRDRWVFQETGYFDIGFHRRALHGSGRRIQKIIWLHQLYSDRIHEEEDEKIRHDLIRILNTGSESEQGNRIKDLEEFIQHCLEESRR